MKTLIFRNIPVEKSDTKFAVFPKRIILHPQLRPGTISTANKQRLGRHPFYHDLMLLEVPDLHDELLNKERSRIFVKIVTHFGSNVQETSFSPTLLIRKFEKVFPKNLTKMFLGGIWRFKLFLKAKRR